MSCAFLIKRRRVFLFITVYRLLENVFNEIYCAMEMDMMPVFNNCYGKVFDDKVVLASPLRENHVELNSISKLRLVTRFNLDSVLWVLISVSFFLMIYHERNIHGWIYSVVYGLSIAFTILSLIMVEKSHHIMLLMNDGSKKKIAVSKNKKKDAEKFVAVAMKKQGR